MNSEDIKALIATGFACEHIEVEGDGRHWFAVIVSSAFEGQSRVQRQRMVNAHGAGQDGHRRAARPVYENPHPCRMAGRASLIARRAPHHGQTVDTRWPQPAGRGHHLLGRKTLPCRKYARPCSPPILVHLGQRAALARCALAMRRLLDHMGVRTQTHGAAGRFTRTPFRSSSLPAPRARSRATMSLPDHRSRPELRCSALQLAVDQDSDSYFETPAPK